MQKRWARQQRKQWRKKLSDETFKLDIKLTEEQKAKKYETMKLFLTVFDTEAGKKVLDYLDKYSHTNFPNYDNVYATYSKIGEQALVDYIKILLENAKKGGK